MSWAATTEIKAAAVSTATWSAGSRDAKPSIQPTTTSEVKRVAATAASAIEARTLTASRVGNRRAHRGRSLVRPAVRTLRPARHRDAQEGVVVEVDLEEGIEQCALNSGQEPDGLERLERADHAGGGAE